MTVRIPTHREPVTPGEMLLEEYLKPLGLTQVRAARMLGVPIRRLNEIIVGRRAVTPDTALRLERVFGASAQSWLNLQLAVDLHRAQRRQSAREIRALKRAPGIGKPDAATLAVDHATI